jgi:magnesium transporter
MYKKVFSSNLHDATSRVRKLMQKLGTAPGTVIYTGKQPPGAVNVHVTDFDEKGVKRLTLDNSFSVPAGEHRKRWIQVIGLHNTGLIKEIGLKLEIPSLVLEDVVNSSHPAKIEIQDNFLFVILKVPIFNEKTMEIHFEHISVLLFENLIVSFQESDMFHFESLLYRMQQPDSRMRRYGCEYLMYSMIDFVVDTYTFLADVHSEQLDLLEDEVMSSPHGNHVNQIHALKQRIAATKKACRPLRTIADTLSSGDLPLISNSISPYLKDLRDHVNGLLDTIESHRESASMVMDSYLSLMSHRMNEIMKVLTMMSAIFIPLGFLAGLYGMNFDHMPELHFRYAYHAVLSVMAALAIGMLILFKMKKWF